MRRLGSALVFSILSLHSSGNAQTFTKIVGSGDAIPGGTFSFHSFEEAPGLVGDHLAYIGVYTDLNGPVNAIFSNASGSFTRVVKTGDPIPGGPGTPLQFILRLAIDDDAIAFEGSTFVGGSPRTAIVTDATGVLLDVVDTSTFLSGSGFFTQIGGQDFSYDAGQVVFNGFLSAGVRGVYSVDENGQNLVAVADSNTTAPGAGMSVNFFTFGAPTIRDGRVVFHASAGGQLSVYEQVGPGIGPVTRMIGAGDASPSGSPFSFLFEPRIDEDDTLFYGLVNGAAGLYSLVNGSVSLSADSSSAVPGGSGTFGDFDDFAISNERIVFESTSSITGNWDGIFTNICNGLASVIRPGDIVDGKPITIARIDEDSLDGDRLAMNISFSDGSSGIYVVDLTTVENSGLPYAGSATIPPRIEAVGCPTLGDTFGIHLRHAPVGGGLLFLGLLTENLTIPGGGHLLVRPDWVTQIVANAPNYGHTSGWFDIVQNVPNNPSLSGITIHVQAAWMDPLVPNGWQLTDRLTLPIP